MHGTCCVQAADIPDGAELFISSGEPFKPEGQSAHTVAICVPASLHPCAPALVGPTLPIRPALCTHPVALSSPKRCSFVRLCMRLCVHAITLVCMRSRLCACDHACVHARGHLRWLRVLGVMPVGKAHWAQRSGRAAPAAPQLTRLR